MILMNSATHNNHKTTLTKLSHRSDVGNTTLVTNHKHSISTNIDDLDTNQTFSFLLEKKAEFSLAILHALNIPSIVSVSISMVSQAISSGEIL